MNNWNFTGNLGKDAEQRYLTNGDSIVSFSVAAKSGYGDKAKTSWARCSMFGKRGESVLPYLTKGQLVGITGEVTLNEYTAKDGTTKSSLEVRVNDLTLLGKREPGSEQHSSAQQDTTPRQAPAPSGNSFDDLDSDIPF